MGDEGLEKVLEQAEIKGLNTPLRQLDVIHEIGSAAEVERHLSERFIERNRSPAESAYPVFCAECLLQRLAEHDTDVFNRVVIVDLRIAFRLDRQVEESMLAQKLQHVIQKRDRRLDMATSNSIEPELNANLSFRRIPFNQCAT
jgi:hypothetical protein